MDGFGVPVAALRDAGASAMAVASGAREVDLAGLVRALGAAVPGGAVAQAGTDAGATWAACVASLAEGMNDHAGALTASARAYAQAEAGAATGLRVR